MIISAGGSIAPFDAERTRAIYADLPQRDGFDCSGCRNYNAGWTADCFGPDLLEACSTMGIDPSKARETTALSRDGDGDAVWYFVQLPFFGIVTYPESSEDEPSLWGFCESCDGSARVAEGVAGVIVHVKVPWVLDEPNTYVP